VLSIIIIIMYRDGYKCFSVVMCFDVLVCEMYVKSILVCLGLLLLLLLLLL